MSLSGVPAVSMGRSAWTARGKDNYSNLYRYNPNYPMDGAYPTKDMNYQAVHLAVKAIQARLKDMGFAPGLTVTGTYDTATTTAVKAAQTYYGLSVTGAFNSELSMLIWRQLLETQAARYGVKPKYLWGIMFNESTADPGAVGYGNPPDSGLVQINTAAHEEVTPAMAYDPNYAFNYLASRLKRNFVVKYPGKGAALQEACSIAEWNAPAWADQWYSTGVAPNTTISTYVSRVLGYATEYVPTPVYPKPPAPLPGPTPPPAPRTYTVVSGDSLSSIGSKTGVPWATIASLNGINSPYVIYIGQVLKLN